MKKFFKLLSFLVLSSLFLIGCSGTGYDANVRLVREGHLNMNPGVPIGKAFDQFFINDSWKSFTSTENEKIVEFKGDCTFFNAPVTMKIQFKLSGNEFEVKYVGMDDIDLDYFEGLGVVEKVLSEYRP